MEAPSPVRRTGARTKVLALLLGCALVLPLAEIALRIAAFSVEPERRAEEPHALEAGRRILCIGDSNTFGVHLESRESYPGQLQRLLERAPGQDWKVVNAGYPGTNSAEARLHFAENLERYRPEIAVVWIGVNDTWSLAMSHLWELPDREEPEPSGAWWTDLRVVRLTRILIQHASEPAAPAGEPGPLDHWIDADGRLPFEQFGAPIDPTKQAQPSTGEVRERLMLDLRRMAEMCRDRGVKLALCTYPYQLKVLTATVNPAIAAAASANGALLIDLMPRMAPLYRRFGADNLLFPDFHQKAPDNREVARVVLTELCAAGWIESRPEWSSIRPLEVALPHLRLLPRGVREGKLELELYGNPGWLATFELRPLARSDSGGEPAALGAPPPAGSGLEPSGLVAALEVALDGSGWSHVALPLPAPAIGEVWCRESGARWEGWCLRANGRPGEGVAAEAGAAQDLHSDPIRVPRDLLGG